MKIITRIKLHKGFSLVDILVVIAVITMMAEIAITAMSIFFVKADRSKNRRNAQNMEGTFCAARAAGDTNFSATKEMP